MSLFSGLSKAVKKAGNFLEDKILEPISKDIIPAGAAYLTGGQSLAFIPPSNSGALSGLSDSIFGVKAGDLANSILGGNKSTQERTEYVTAQANLPVAQQQQLYQNLTPSVRSTSDLASSPQVGDNAPQLINSGMSTQTIMMIGGAIGAVALIILMGKKK